MRNARSHAPQGTAFYALQSCANHSCAPLATAEGEASGEASILALGDIAAGQAAGPLGSCVKWFNITRP